jgi:hypothetical protein
MRVFVHSNMLKLLKSSRLNRIPLWCIVDNLIGYLDTGIAAGLVDAGYDSVYSHNGNPTLLYGLLRFLPHHCSSKLVLNGRTQFANRFDVIRHTVRILLTYRAFSNKVLYLLNIDTMTSESSIEIEPSTVYTRMEFASAMAPTNVVVNIV